MAERRKRTHERVGPVQTDLFRPNAGWLLAAAGVLAGLTLERIDIPLWLAATSVPVLLLGALFWPWIHRTRRRVAVIWSGFVLYAVAAACIATLTEGERPIIFVRCPTVHSQIAGTSQGYVNVIVVSRQDRPLEPSGYLHVAAKEGELLNAPHPYGGRGRGVSSKCHFENFSETPLIDVEMTFRVEYTKAYRQPRDSQPVNRSDWRVVLPSIPRGGEWTAFIGSNEAGEFAYVHFPQSAFASVPGEDSRQAIVVEYRPMIAVNGIDRSTYGDLQFYPLNR